ncbi:hypothetical protein [Arthrobacter woluwensis]|jgi:hypothetical protein|uniref:hypothetical protein n=1 Tax=Arthrobacter woluwensis TaxID=156980 RepID=UPI001AAEFCAD|nr:hypothetical protein [Arthrobacter woluwensis]QTF71086.1 hypothetical protein G8758_02980 [Arthrobacter woluwensis]
MRNAFTPSRVAVTITSLVLILTGCSQEGQNAEFDSSARARLDLAESRIILPVSDYDLSPADLKIIDRARETALGPCMNLKGFQTDPEASGAIGKTGDRLFGLWNVEWAKHYGYISGPGARKGTEPPKPPGWDEAHGECAKNPDFVTLTAPFTPLETFGSEPSLVSKISGDADGFASNTPEWRKAREDWRACLRKQGLTPRTEDRAWSSQQANDLLGRIDANHPSASDKEEEIRIATTEAQCNQDTRLTQRLGDLEAGYQAPLIAKNQAALNEEKTRNQGYVAAAKKYLADHQ